MVNLVTLLYWIIKCDFKRPLQDFPNYEDLILPKGTRTMKDTWNCYICITSWFNGHVKIIKGKGKKKRNIKNVIDASNELYGHLSLQPDQSSDSKVFNSSEIAKMCICNKCFLVISSERDQLEF